MYDLLLDELPTQLDGYEIDPDFRPMCWMANQILRGSLSPDKDPAAFIRQLCARFFRQRIPEYDLPRALHTALRFYAGPATPKSEQDGTGRSGDSILFDYETDAPYIVAAFQQVYHIDLTAEKMHWWRFRALFNALPEDTKLAQIISVRRKDLSKVSDPEQRQQYEQLQEIYALPKNLKGGAPRIVSVADHDAAFLARLAPGK